MSLNLAKKIEVRFKAQFPYATKPLLEALWEHETKKRQGSLTFYVRLKKTGFNAGQIGMTPAGTDGRTFRKASTAPAGVLKLLHTGELRGQTGGVEKAWLASETGGVAWTKAFTDAVAQQMAGKRPVVVLRFILPPGSTWTPTQVPHADYIVQVPHPNRTFDITTRQSNFLMAYLEGQMLMRSEQAIGDLAPGTPPSNDRGGSGNIGNTYGNSGGGGSGNGNSGNGNGSGSGNTGGGGGAQQAGMNPMTALLLVGAGLFLVKQMKNS